MSAATLTREKFLSLSLQPPWLKGSSSFCFCRATLKNKKEVCLDPETPVMKKIIQKMLDRYPVALICVLFNLF